MELVLAEVVQPAMVVLEDSQDLKMVTAKEDHCNTVQWWEGHLIV